MYFSCAHGFELLVIKLLIVIAYVVGYLSCGLRFDHISSPDLGIKKISKRDNILLNCPKKLPGSRLPDLHGMSGSGVWYIPNYFIENGKIPEYYLSGIFFGGIGNSKDTNIILRAVPSWDLIQLFEQIEEKLESLNLDGNKLKTLSSQQWSELKKVF